MTKGFAFFKTLTSVKSWSLFQKYQNRSVANKFTNDSKHQHAQNFGTQHQLGSRVFKLVGYGLGSLVTVITASIITWPMAEKHVLPNAICQSLIESSRSHSDRNRKQNANDKQENKKNFKIVHKFWGRDYELQQLQSMMKEDANNIWILTGSTNCGKSALIKQLKAIEPGVIYIDLRHFLDANTFIPEMIDSLYDGLNKYKELKKNYQNESDRHNIKNVPLIVFDHFEALPAALQHCENEKTRELLISTMHNISQFATSICHDNGLAHVAFIGDQYFTMRKSDLDFRPKYDKSQITFSEWFWQDGDYIRQRLMQGIVCDLDENFVSSHIDGIRYLSPNISDHCEYWSIGGIEINTAIEWIYHNWNEKLGLNLPQMLVSPVENTQDVDKNQESKQLEQLCRSLIRYVGNKPFMIEKMCIAIVENIQDTTSDDIETKLYRNNYNVLNQLSDNIERLKQTCKQQWIDKSKELLKLNNIACAIGVDAAVALENSIEDDMNEKFENKSKTSGGDENGNETYHHLLELFGDTKQNFLYRATQTGFLTRCHGPILATNKHEMQNYHFRRLTSNAVNFYDHWAFD